MTANELKPGDRLISNNGRGPVIATVDRIAGERIHLSRPGPGRGRYAWSLEAKYFGSYTCGWRFLISEADEQQERKRLIELFHNTDESLLTIDQLRAIGAILSGRPAPQ